MPLFLASTTLDTIYFIRAVHTGTDTELNSYESHGLFQRIEPSISLSVSPSPLILPNLTPGTPVFATSTVEVTVEDGLDGYILTVKRDSASSTLASSTFAFPDAPDWNSTSSNASLTPGANLSFRVQQSGTTAVYDSVWWGTSDMPGSAKFAGFPSLSGTIVDCNSTSTCNNTTTQVIVAHRADAPATQRATSYEGTVTYTALIKL